LRLGQFADPNGHSENETGKSPANLAKSKNEMATGTPPVATISPAGRPSPPAMAA
jgi:hypothetical protein